MHPDELNKPLGLDKDAQAQRREIPWKAIALGGLAMLGAGVFAFDRLIGPTSQDAAARTAALAPPKAPQTKPDAPAHAAHDDVTASINAPPPRASAGQVEENSGVRVFRQGGGAAPGALIITVPQSNVSLVPAPDKRLVEDGRHGPLPKIGADGSKPMDVYSRPLVESSKLPPGAPRVAILIGGMGINSQTTENAIASLPAGVTLGFAPYGRNLAAQSAKARDKGHETILQTPMEGFGGEAEEPGPHVLRTGAPQGETINRLHWHMSRVQGYVGIAGFLGARFTADADAFGPVMRELAKRGLFYFDDGGSPRSLASSLAAGSGAPLVRADVGFDGKSGAALDDALAQLEKIARERGSAVGYGTALPGVIDKVGRFARRLEARGILLAPVSALARVPDQAAARAVR
jgi:polysaccharide deacetylase 2 family uncharacterized protein YibQ